VEPGVDLAIDELVLEGLSPGDARRIGEAAGAALRELFEREGVPAALTTGGTAVTLDAGAFVVPPGARPEAVGGLLARAVYRAIGEGGGR
jgi:hypothetical protein